MRTPTDAGLSLTTLTYRQQRNIHEYHLPAKEISEEQLLNHRAKVADERPALASAAGKAFRQLEELYPVIYLDALVVKV